MRCLTCYRVGCTGALCRRGWRQDAGRLIAFAVMLVLLVVASNAWGWDTNSPIQVNPQNTYASASASNATATLTGVTGKRARVLAYSATCNVGAASLTIANGATQIWHDVITTATSRVQFSTPLQGSQGNTVTVTLSSCGTGNVGHLSVEGDIY